MCLIHPPVFVLLSNPPREENIRKVRYAVSLETNFLYSKLLFSCYPSLNDANQAVFIGKTISPFLEMEVAGVRTVSFPVKFLPQQVFPQNCWQKNNDWYLNCTVLCK